MIVFVRLERVSLTATIGLSQLDTTACQTAVMMHRCRGEGVTRLSNQNMITLQILNMLTVSVVIYRPIYFYIYDITVLRFRDSSVLYLSDHVMSSAWRY